MPQQSLPRTPEILAVGVITGDPRRVGLSSRSGAIPTSPITSLALREALFRKGAAERRAGLRGGAAPGRAASS